MVLMRRVFAITAALAAATGCTASPQPSSGAPPLIICGTTLWSGAEGALTTDATGSSVAVTMTSSGNEIYLRLTNDCRHGAKLVVSGAQAKIVAVARSRDGRMAAVALTPLASSFQAVVDRARGSTTTITVKLTSR